MLPTADQINPDKCLDGNCAEVHFLGKSVDAAAAMFAENPLCYQEDLMWMGTEGFCFYFPIYDRYLRSDDACGDSDAVSALAAVLEFQVLESKADLSSIASVIRSLVGYVVNNYSRFDIDHEIYGDVKSRLQSVASRLGV